MQGFGLSPQQKRLWKMQQQSTSYCAQGMLMLEGPLDTQTLRRALQEMVQRHGILRTTFPCVPGMQIPFQVIADQGLLTCREVDLRGLSLGEQQSVIESLAKQEALSPFDFEAGPLLRLLLLSLAQDKSALLISLPCLCADAWTLRTLMRGIGLFYSDDLESRMDLNSEPLQYVQFSEWQNELLQDPEAEIAREYWSKQGISKLANLSLPFKHTTARSAGFEPAFFSLTLDEETKARLVSLAQRHQVSLAAFLLTCWQLLLWRLTDQSEIVVGSLSNPRDHHPELQDAMGLVSKWLPVYCSFQSTQRFDEILSRIDTSLSEADKWWEYFTLDSPSDNHRSTYFPIGFEYEQGPMELFVADVKFSVCKQYCCMERFEIQLRCIEDCQKLMLEFGYNSQFYSIEEIKRIAAHMETLLGSVCGDDESDVSELEILSANERRRILFEFNVPIATNNDQQKNLVQLFEEQVERTPDFVALAFREQRLTYEELNERANRLGNYLRRRGIGPEVLVAIYMERSLEMMVATMGVLKAGGAYVPLDASYPRNRIAYLLRDTQARIVLTQESLAAEIPGAGIRILCIDGDWTEVQVESDQNLALQFSDENLAYVIYTSGSTGEPKGVMVQHNSVVNLARSLHRAIYANHDWPLRVSLNAPLVFDASVKQWAQLLYGHALHILPEEVRSDPRELLAYIDQQSLDVLDCTPSQLKLLLREGWSSKISPYPKIVLVGGEQLDEATWAAMALMPEKVFYNVYGPTECTVDSTVFRVSSASAEPTIGRALSNVQVFVLDEHLRPAPIGVIGQLHVGGRNLARGYLNEPALTAERFIPAPFGDVRGARVYKTGDLACFFPDGNLKFFGRTDHQVKLRGFRIEPGEIETALNRHPEVRQAVVLVREDDPDNKQLIAYVVLDPSPASSLIELRNFLRESLPEYMIPSAFVVLNSIPLTHTGKVDRRRLPPPSRDSSELATNYVAPRNELERVVVGIWQQVLGRDHIGVNDNFFDLGGNSLLIVQVHHKLRTLLKRELSLIDLFKNPTVSLLVRFLSTKNPPKPSFQAAVDRAFRRRTNLISEI